MPDQASINSTSQKFLDIYDVVNDLILLKNGSASMALTVNAMNFGLLAEAEQDAVIFSYAGLLNSLNFPVQIVIRSETKDASSYLKILKEREEKTTDKVKRAWIQRYSQFISKLIQERNVLDKKFYVVIPASGLEMGLTPAQNIVSGFKEPSTEGVEKSVMVEKALTLLEPKRDHLIAQFNRIGLYARQLNTQEIIRLFYTNYNPEATEGQQITDSQSYTTPLVQAQVKGGMMNLSQSSTPTQSTQGGNDNQPDATANQGNTDQTFGQGDQSQSVEPTTANQVPPAAPVAPPHQPAQAKPAVQTDSGTPTTQPPTTQPPAAPVTPPMPAVQPGSTDTSTDVPASDSASASTEPSSITESPRITPPADQQQAQAAATAPTSTQAPAANQGAAPATKPTTKPAAAPTTKSTSEPVEITPPPTSPTSSGEENQTEKGSAGSSSVPMPQADLKTSAQANAAQSMVQPSTNGQEAQQEIDTNLKQISDQPAQEVKPTAKGEEKSKT